MPLFLEPSEKNNHLIYLFICAVFVTLDCKGEAEQKLTFYPLSFLTQFFTHLKLCLAKVSDPVTYNFKWMKMTENWNCLIWDQIFANIKTVMI